MYLVWAVKQANTCPHTMKTESRGEKLAELVNIHLLPMYVILVTKFFLLLSHFSYVYTFFVLALAAGLTVYHSRR